MVRAINKLSSRTVESLRRNGRHSDGGGLYLFITGDARRRWIFRYTRGGKTVEMGLGAAGRGGVSLAQARNQAAEARRVLADGGDPLGAKRSAAHARAGKPTFGRIADEYVEVMRSSWRNAKHAWQWGATLRSCLAIWDLSVDEVDTDGILKVLEPMWKQKPETAQRLRGRIEKVLDHARARGFRSGENPARWRGHLDQLLPKRRRLTRGHHPALPYSALPAFMRQLREREAPTAQLLEFTILTAARSGEARLAEWGEIDFEKALWTVPGTRMKAGREHRVPLSSRAVEILNGDAPSHEWKVCVRRRARCAVIGHGDARPAEANEWQRYYCAWISVCLPRLGGGGDTLLA